MPLNSFSKIKIQTICCCNIIVFKIIYKVVVLLNQRVCLPQCSNAHLLTLDGCGGKCNIYCRCQERSPWQLVLKGPNTLMASRERFSKPRLRECVAGCVISSWTFFCMIGGEVMVSQHHQPSGSSWSGVYVLMGKVYSALPPHGGSVSVKQLKDMA